LIRNKACPGFSSFTANEERENTKYRLYTIAHLPNLSMLDCSPVTKKERTQAVEMENERRRGLVEQRMAQQAEAQVTAVSAPPKGAKVGALPVGRPHPNQRPPVDRVALVCDWLSSATAWQAACF
jgi:hypothetical protein